MPTPFVNNFQDFLSQQAASNCMTREEYTAYFLSEGVMSNIHLMADASKDWDDFLKKFKRDYKKVFQNTPEFMDWLYGMYKDMAPTKAGETVEERRTGINRYSPMSYAEMVLDGEMDVMDAAKESGMGIAALVSLIQKIDKTFKLVIKEGDEQSDQMAYGQLERCIDFATMLRERMDNGYTLDPWMYNKVAIAEDYLNTVFGALDGDDGEVEQDNL